MTLRKQILTITGLTFFGLTVILLVSFSVIIRQGIETIEIHDVQRDVRQVVNALENEISILDSQVMDYANWDDTYAFVVHPSEAYVKSNFTRSTFEHLRLNLILVVDKAGRFVYGAGFDRQKGEWRPLPKDLRERLSVHPRLLRHTSVNDRVGGLLLFPEAPMLLVSRPILTSEASGPIRGAFLMGRLLTDREIDRLSRLTQSWLTVHSLDRRPDPAVPPEILSQLGAREGIAVRPEDRKWIGGYALMKDLSGKPALVLRVMVDRLIDRQGRFMVLYLMAALVLIGVAFGLSNLLLLKRSVLQPLQGIVADVEAISGRGAFSERVSASARGEMAGLASAVNGLLDRLDDTQRKLMTESARYRAIVDYQSEFICRFLSDGTITFVNDALCRFVDRPRDEIVGDSILSLIGPEAQDQLRSQMRLLTPESPNIALDEFPLVLSDGRVRWLLWNARAIFDAEGRLQEYQAAARDITKDKAFLEEYQRSVEGVRQAKIEWEGSVDALEELIFLVDDRTCVVRANRTLEAWSLGRVEAGIGRPLHELLHPGCADAACGLEAFLNEALGRIPVGETVHREFDDPQIGKVIDVRLRTVFLKSDGMDEARSDLSVVVIQDISARRKAEKALLAVNEKLAEANRKLGLAYAWMRDKKDELKQRIFHEEMAVLLNSEGRIEGVSDKVVECLEQSRDGLIGRKMLDLIREGFREDFSWELRQAWMGMAQDIPIGFADVKRCAGIFEAKLTRLTLSGVRLVLMTMR